MHFSGGGVPIDGFVSVSTQPDVCVQYYHFAVSKPVNMYKFKSVWCTVDESILMPEFEEGTSLKEQLRVLLDRLETAQSNALCKCMSLVTDHI